MDEGESSEEEVFHDVDWSTADPIFDYEEVKCRLILATLQDDLDTVKTLVESGFSINTNNNQGNTPLHLAVLQNQKELFDYILTVEHLQIDAENFQQMTPLMCAVQSGLTYFTEHLLQKGASVSVRNSEESTLLHEVDNIKVALILLAHNIDIDAVDCRGRTPLYVACEKGDCEMACMFLCYGANPTIACSRGELPLIVALSTCPLFFQEILFDYNFHENEKSPIHLHSLVGSIQKSLFFANILEKSSGIFFDKQSLFKLAGALDTLSFDYFKQIVHLCSHNFAEKFTLVIVRHRKYEFFKNPQVLDYFEFFCREAYVSNAFTLDVLFKANKLKRKPSRVFGDSLNNMIYLLLSYGSELKLYQLDTIYRRQGFSDFFETMLHMEVNDLLLTSTHYSIVNLIYDIRYNLVRYLHQHCCKHCMCKVFPHVKRRFSELSLLELSRDAARKHLMECFNLKNCGQFLAVVKRLEIAAACKDVLMLKRF